MCALSKDHHAYYREMADKLEELARLARQGSQQDLPLINRLSQLTAAIRKDVGGAPE